MIPSKALLEELHGSFPFEGTQLDAIENHGLFLDRYLPAAEAKGEKKLLTAHLDALAEIPVPAVYSRALDDERSMFDRQQIWPTAVREMQVDEQMIVGLRAASVHETGISLLSTYGLPFVPGSALKAWQGGSPHRCRWSEVDGPDQDQLDVLFGYQRPHDETGESISAAGRITFHDAWFVPDDDKETGPFLRESRGSAPFRIQHEPGKGRQAISMISSCQYLTSMGTYLVAVTGPTEEWTNHALDLIAAALSTSGVGAKTSSGFGRMTHYEPPPPPPEW
ncbi:MAG: hypothetical protein R3A46_15135 [Thermomicrobiales bacterium]